ncbi:BppU family phage baseplate upper protein [Clostridium intestinale]|uniref:BppU N-terminal domain-containing protein n=1 Tax=Clostridium intestinale TaxID=36845 RepID=A0A7D6VTN3_9CLOT|nr:BppU family phage baseplate upper protein [Clostridium intestinale]QLY82226.1 hypothetical protein HZF06_11745 [Clostridium intestinale]
MEALRVPNIIIDLNEIDYNVKILKQLDNTKITMQILNGGVPVDLSGNSFILNFGKSDNTVVIQTNGFITSQLSSGILSVELDIDCLRVAGSSKMELEIHKDSKKISSYIIECEVKASLVDSMLPSENKITLTEELNQTIQEGVNTKEELENVIATANTTTYATKGEINEVNSLLEDMTHDTTTMELECVADDSTDDSAKINAFLSASNDRFLFLNQGVHSASNKILVNMANTSIKGNAYARGWLKDRLRKSVISAKHSGDILEVNVPSSENGTYIENISLYGNDMARDGLVIGDYEFSGSDFRKINVLNCLNNAYTLKGNNYGTYYEKLFCSAVKNGIVLEKGNSHNMEFDGCHIYSTDVCLDLLTNADTGVNISKSLVFRSCDFTHIGTIVSSRKWIKTGRCRNIIFDSCFFESNNASTVDYLIELGTATHTTHMVTFKNCHFSFTNINYFAKLTNVLYLVFDNCYFESVPLLGWFLASTNTANTVQQKIFGSFNSVISRSVPLIVALSGDTALNLQDVFKFFVNSSSVSTSHQEGGYTVNSDNTANYIFRGYDADRTTYPQEFVRIRKDSVHFGDGSSAPAVGFRRLSTGELYGDGNFFLQGRWNLNFLRLNNVRIFADSSNNIRVKKGSDPTSETDGQIVTLS